MSAPQEQTHLSPHQLLEVQVEKHQHGDTCPNPDCKQIAEAQSCGSAQCTKSRHMRECSACGGPMFVRCEMPSVERKILALEYPSVQ